MPVKVFGFSFKGIIATLSAVNVVIDFYSRITNTYSAEVIFFHHSRGSHQLTEASFFLYAFISFTFQG